ncbi:MAG: hypothetical protein ACK5LL_10875 [Suipraeoptans sp.]
MKKISRYVAFVLLFACIVPYSLALRSNDEDKSGLIIENQTPYTLENIRLMSTAGNMTLKDIDALSSKNVKDLSELSNSFTLIVTVNNVPRRFNLTNVKFSIQENGYCTVTISTNRDFNILCNSSAISD